MRRVMGILMATGVVLTLTACERSAEIIMPDEPVLQVDAVFIEGEPLPEIQVRRSFAVTGSRPRTIHSDDIWARGAVVRLRRNGEEIDVHETAAGRYRPVTDVPVARYDVYLVEVGWDGLAASAEARVPGFDFDQVTVDAGAARFVRTNVVGMYGEETEFDVFESRVRFRQPVAPAVQLIRFTTASTLDVLSRYGSHVVSTPPSYATVYRNAATTDHLDLEVDVLDVHPTERRGESGTTILVNVLVPEPIYADYQRTGSHILAPATVTNVDGGVGLVIGAAAHTFEVEVERVMGE